MLTALLFHCLMAVGVFFLLLMMCAWRDLSLEKSLAASGLWTGVFLLLWHPL